MCDHASHIASAITNDNQSRLHATSAPGEGGPISAHVVCPLMTVDQNLMNRQRPYSVATTSFTQEIVFASLLLRIVKTSGFPDETTHVHSFHERRGALVCVSQALCTWQVASLWRVHQGQEQSNTFPFVLQARGSPDSNRDFVSARSHGIEDKIHSWEELQGTYAQETVSHEQQPMRTVNETITRVGLNVALKGDNVCFVGGDWESCVSRSVDLALAYMMVRHLQKKLPEFLELERKYGVCLGQR